MITRIIEVFSSTTEEFICEFTLDDSWTVSKLHEIVKIDENDHIIYLIYKLSRAQVFVLGGSHLLELNDGNVDFFLSYNGSP